MASCAGSSLVFMEINICVQEKLAHCMCADEGKFALLTALQIIGRDKNRRRFFLSICAVMSARIYLADPRSNSTFTKTTAEM